MRDALGSAFICLPLLLAAGCSETTAPTMGTPQARAIGSGSTAGNSAFPALQTAGWVGGDAVSLEQLAGNVAVIDCFASW
jgi:hypothetical protein